LGKLGTDAHVRAKRLRYRYLNVAGIVVSTGRRLPLKLRAD
jgi:hypothetical protein